jgi:hypothetical protein
LSTFLKTNITPEGFIRGAGRLILAPLTETFPTEIDDMIDISGATPTYDVQGDWEDVGATKNGINITRNNAEEEFDVDQIQGAIAALPTNWEMSVATQLSEVTLERISLVWETSDVTTNTSTASGVDEKQITIGQPATYVVRRLAVLFQRNDLDSGGDNHIRAYAFRKAQRTPQEATITHNKTGDQVVIPVTFRILADDDVADVDARFGAIFDQVA